MRPCVSNVTHQEIKQCLSKSSESGAACAYRVENIDQPSKIYNITEI